MVVFTAISIGAAACALYVAADLVFTGIKNIRQQKGE